MSITTTRVEENGKDYSGEVRRKFGKPWRAGDVSKVVCTHATAANTPLCTQTLESLALWTKGIPNVSFFSLTNCQIHGGIPTSFSSSSLKYLILTGNELKGNIPDLSSCTGMKQCLLGNNKLSGFANPQMFSTMPELATLNLR